MASPAGDVAAPLRPRVTGWLAHWLARAIRVRGLGHRASAVALAITTRIIGANAIAGLFVAAYLTITEEVPDGEWGPVILANALLYAGAVLLFTTAAVVRGKHVFAPAWRWLDGDDRPTDKEVRDLLAQPVHMGLFPLRYWTAAAICSMTARAVVGSDLGQVVVVGVALLIGGLVAALIGFLLGERVLRPVFAEALAGRAPDAPAALGVTTRLVLAWALAAGVPLGGILLTPVLVPDARLGTNVATVFLASTGLAAGLIITLRTARSVTVPLHQVRASLRAVGEGELDTTVVVNDPGDIGQLQAGVNEMVAGLRERDRLEDLFGRHVGAAVARQAIEQGVHLGGEVREVTALFVDLRGSTELTRRLDPVEVVALLNRFFAAVVARCDAEGGWLDKFAGDGALCVFGAPTDQPDHATRGLRTARLLARDLAELRRRQPDLDAGIGVASGKVVAGHVGTESRLEFTVIGDPVNVAARLTVAAKERAARVLADASVVDASAPDERACWDSAGTVDLRGLPAGLPVWEPVPIGSAP